MLRCQARYLSPRSPLANTLSDLPSRHSYAQFAQVVSRQACNFKCGRSHSAINRRVTRTSKMLILKSMQAPVKGPSREPLAGGCLRPSTAAEHHVQTCECTGSYHKASRTQQASLAADTKESSMMTNRAMGAWPDHKLRVGGARRCEEGRGRPWRLPGALAQVAALKACPSCTG